MATKQTKSMVSEVSICNQALLWVGQGTITSLQDPGTNAEWCDRNYPFIRDAVLEERMWTFARDRYQSDSAELSAWGNLYKHRKPTDWLSVFRVYDDAGADPFNDIQEDWSVEGEFVLHSEPTVYMWGLKRVTDTGKMTGMFAQCLSARLASHMSIPLAGNRQLQADYWNLYQSLLADAAVRDGQQGTNNRVQSNALIDARSRTLSL